jgi:tricorn protease-like protein/C-terminal processing protease CtpA/Prc
MKNFSFIICLSFLVTLYLNAQSTTLLRHPAINFDGSLISFSYQGDIWTVPAAGGKATRLTIHKAYESNPRFSPDGKQIAFSGLRFGNDDIFVIPSGGGQAKRLTFHSGNDVISSWTQADKILFSANREFRQLERPSEIYAINPSGGTESRILGTLGFDPVLSPDGRFMAFVRGDINPIARQAYTGSSNRELWLYDTQKKSYQKLPGFVYNDITPQWVGNQTLYFLSSNEGTYNLYRLKLDTEGHAQSKPEKLTNYSDESIRAFSISADGSTAVFERETDFYLMKVGKGDAKKLNIEISADERWDATEQKVLNKDIENYAVSPNSKLIAFAVRGEIFIREDDKDKSRSVNISNHSYRDVQPVWLSDSTVLFTSDREDCNFDIYMASSSDTSQTNIFKTLKHKIIRCTRTATDETDLTISPDGKKISFIRGRGTLIVADINANGSIVNEKILNDHWDAASEVVWSPDSKWLSYSQEDLYFNREVFIQPADNTSKPVNVSMHPRSDRHPYWSADGSKLGFISERSAGRSEDVWFVWLKKEDWEKSMQDWLDGENSEPQDEFKPKQEKDKKGVSEVKIDFDKIHERIVQVTNFPGNESDFVISKDGESFYYITSSTSAKGRDLYSIKWDGKNLKEITKGGADPSGLWIDKDGKNIYFSKSGTLGRMDTKSNATENLPFAAKMKIDYAAERNQIFDEAWRTIRDGFYDPHFHGYDWNKLKAKYRNRCIYASTENDFRDMFNLMLGELNASHMGLTVPDRSDTQKETTGLLGAELMPVSEGMMVSLIIPETPSDKGKDKLTKGDIITAVNGQTINRDENFYNLLNGLANEKVVLTVTNREKKTSEVVVRLTESIVNQLYKSWVDNRKKLVDQYSGGRLGYIHIKSMDFPSFEVVERDFTAAGYGKEGLIIDVRYNGGGSTTDYLMAILNYKQHAYTIPRGASDNPEKDKLKFTNYYPTGERLVYAAWMKPSIALCNEGSYSNAEIFSHAYKSLGIGKLVGIPTNGSVISTGGKVLMDGSFVRLPSRMWFTKATNKNQELGPAVPDIMVENDPNWLETGVDNQLKVAAEELLRQIDSKK